MDPAGAFCELRGTTSVYEDTETNVAPLVLELASLPPPGSTPVDLGEAFGSSGSADLQRFYVNNVLPISSEDSAGTVPRP